MTGPETADPFDLPDWVGGGECVWTTSDSIGDTRVEGVLSGEAGKIELSVLASDVAYPRPVLREQLRHDAHQAWAHGEVLLFADGDRFVLPVPGTNLDIDLLCEAIRRFARAVGAAPASFTVALQL